MPAPNFKLLEMLIKGASPRARELAYPQGGEPRRIGVSEGQQKFKGNVLLGKNNVGDPAFVAYLQQAIDKLPQSADKIQAQKLVDSIAANATFSGAIRTIPGEESATYARKTGKDWKQVERNVAGGKGFYIYPEHSKKAADLGKKNFVSAREVLDFQREAINKLHIEGKGPPLREMANMASGKVGRIQLTPEHVEQMARDLKKSRGLEELFWPESESLFNTEKPQEVLDRMRIERTGETDTQPPVVTQRSRDEIMADTNTTVEQPSSFDPNRKNTSNVLDEVATTLPGFRFTAGQGNTGLLHVTWDGQPEIPLKEAISNPKYKIPLETKRQLSALSKSLAPLRGEPDGSGGYIPLPEPNMHEASASQAKALIEGKKQIEDPDNPSGLQITSEEERQQSLEENKSSQDLAEIRNKKKKKRFESKPPKPASAKQIAKLKFELEKLGDSSLQGEAQELMSRVGELPSTEVGNLIDRIKQEQLGPDAPPRDLKTAQLKFTGAKRATAERTLLSSMDKISKGKVSNFGNQISKLIDSFQGLAETDAKTVEKFMEGLTPEKQSIVAERLMKHPGGDAVLSELSKKFNAERDAASVRQDVEEPTEKSLSIKKPSRSPEMSKARAKFLKPTLEDIASQLPRVGISDKGRLQNDPAFKRKLDVPENKNPLLQLTGSKAAKLKSKPIHTAEDWYEEPPSKSEVVQKSNGELKGAKPKTPSEDWFDRIRAKLNDLIRLPEQTTKKVVAKGYKKDPKVTQDFEDLVARIKDMDLRQKQWAARDRPPR